MPAHGTVRVDEPEPDGAKSRPERHLGVPHRRPAPRLHLPRHQALGRMQPSTLIVNTPPNLDVMLQLAALSSSYARLAAQTQWKPSAAHDPGFVPAWYLDVVREQREDAAVAVNTDTYLRRFARPLAAAIQLSAMGQPTAGTGELLAVLAVRTGELVRPSRCRATPARCASSVRVQMAAIDSLTGESVRMDTVREFHAEHAGMVQRQRLALLPHEAGDQARAAARSGCRWSRTTTGEACSAAAIDPATRRVLGERHRARQRGRAVAVAAERRDGAGQPVQFLHGRRDGADLLRTVRAHERRGCIAPMVSLRRAGDTKVASSLSFTRRAPRQRQLALEPDADTERK